MHPRYDVLNFRLLSLSDSDHIFARSAFQGIFVSGGPGSGKTTTVGSQIAQALLGMPQSGALIRTAKAEETPTWIEYAEKCGRGKDVIVFNEKSGHVFDPIAYEWNRKGRGAGDIENIVVIFRRSSPSETSNKRARDMIPSGHAATNN